MPPRSVLLNVFTTARGLDKPHVEESVKELHGQKEEDGIWGTEERKVVKIEGHKSMHIKHDSTQPSPEDSIAIATTYNGFTTSASNNQTPTFIADSTGIAALAKPAISEPLTASPDVAPIVKAFKPVRSCDNCGYTPTAADLTLKQCSRCKLTLYCSAKCQKSAWSVHKKACTPKTYSIPIVDGKQSSTMSEARDDDAKVYDFTPDVSGASTPISPSEDGATSTAATSPGLYFDYKTELLNTPSGDHASASIPPA